MLHYKNEVKENANVSQSKFDWVASDPAPIVLKCRVYHQLQNGKDAAGQVQKNLDDAPADGRLSLVIDPRLGDVFDDGH